MTRLGRMLYDDGKKTERNNMMKLIERMTEDGALEAIPRIAKDPDFYQTMAEKYGVEI